MTSEGSRQPPSMRNILRAAADRNIIWISLWLFLASAIASSPLWQDGWFVSHDVEWHLDRICATSYEIGQGDYYPRWLSVAALGKGLPVLNYYSPGLYLVTGSLQALGIPLELILKALCFLLFLCGSWGMYLWTRKHCGEAGALLAATLYAFVPYRFVDVYVRGALPEFAALALLPFLFHAIDLTFSREGRFRGAIFLSAVSSAIVLTHNLSAFMISPFALLYFGWRVFATKAAPRAIFIAALGFFAGAGLSAYYWLPVIMETGYLAKFEAATAGVFPYSDHFLYPAQWFSSFWGFGFSVAGPQDGMGFQIGYILALFAVVSVASLFYPHRRTKSFGFVTFALGIFGLFLTTSLSSIIYDSIGPMKYVQFPWRYLGPATMFLAALTGVLADALPKSKFPRATLMLLVVALALCVVFSGSQRRVRSRLTGDLDAIGNAKIESKGFWVMGVSDEFLPKWVADESLVWLKFPPVISSMRVENLRIKGSKIRFSAEGSQEGKAVVVTQFYFPGWKAEVDGRSVPVGHTPDGFISIGIPEGRHAVSLWFGTTWPRAAGWLIAALTALALVLVGFRKKFLRP